MELETSASSITTYKYETRDSLYTIEINLAKMDVADRPVQEKRTTQHDAGEASAQVKSSPDRK